MKLKKKCKKKLLLQKNIFNLKHSTLRLIWRGKKERKMVRLFNLKMHKLKEGFGELA